MTETYISIYTVHPLNRREEKTKLNKTNTHLLVDFRIAGAAVGDSVLDYSSCKCAASFQLTQLFINLH